MKYAVISVVNGTFHINSEFADLEKATVNFHSVCMTLWNAEDVEKATVVIANSNMEYKKIETIIKTQAVV